MLVPRQREQPVTVDDDRDDGVDDQLVTDGTVWSPRPSPGPTTSAWKRYRSSSTASAQSKAGTGVATTSIGALPSTPGLDNVHHARAGTLGAGGDEMGGAGHPGAAGDDAHGLRPLVGVGDAVTTSRARRGLDDVHRRRRDVEADVDDADVAGQPRPSPKNRPGFSAANVTVRSAPQRPGPPLP